MPSRHRRPAFDSPSALPRARHSRAVIIDGLAVLRWGEPRLTRDVDFAMLCPDGDEDRIERILAHLAPRIADAAGFAIQNRVLLVRASNGVPVDIALGTLPYEARAVERGSAFEYEPGIHLQTCSAEDLVVMKAFAGRDHDFSDIEGILARQGPRLDWQLILEELRPLLELKNELRNWDRLMETKSSTGIA